MFVCVDVCACKYECTSVGMHICICVHICVYVCMLVHVYNGNAKYKYRGRVVMGIGICLGTGERFRPSVGSTVLDFASSMTKWFAGAPLGKQNRNKKKRKNNTYINIFNIFMKSEIKEKHANVYIKRNLQYLQQDNLIYEGEYRL